MTDRERLDEAVDKLRRATSYRSARHCRRLDLIEAQLQLRILLENTPLHSHTWPPFDAARKALRESIE